MTKEEIPEPKYWIGDVVVFKDGDLLQATIKTAEFGLSGWKYTTKMYRLEESEILYKKP